ncbi:MAG: hypothetical protein KGY99_01580 [Phycisphaerae bacterium]|nr:hypothetical protein [Phycisphaerae bacterium]
MRRLLLPLAALAIVSGCGGQYIVTAPDQIAPVGGRASVVARLTRNEISRLDVPVKRAALEFTVPDSDALRAAFTDSDGFAGAIVPAPDAAGLYEVCIRHQDVWGDRCQGAARLFVWEPDRPAVAVDVAALPAPDEAEAGVAVRAMKRIASEANILYFTQDGVADHAELRTALHLAGYPDGPVLPWLKRRWRLTREGRWSWPRLTFDPRMVGPLQQLREAIPALRSGICVAPAAAKAFTGAEMQVVAVGEADDLPGDARRTSWAEIARTGLGAP